MSRWVVLIFVFGCLLNQVAHAGTVFPKTLFLGIDHGEPPTTSQAHRFLIAKQPVVAEQEQRWRLQPIVDDYFHKHAEHWVMLNLWRPGNKGGDSARLLREFGKDQGTAMGLLRLRGARHMEVSLPGGGKMVYVQLGLTWVVLGNALGRNRTGYAPEVRFSHSVQAIKSFEAQGFQDVHADLPKWYRDTFVLAMEKLMAELARGRDDAGAGKGSMSVMIERVAFGKKTRPRIDSYLEELLRADGVAVSEDSPEASLKEAKVVFEDELKLYLQGRLLNAVRKEKALRGVALLPPEGTLDFLREDWGSYLGRLVEMGFSESSLPEPIIKIVGFACEVNELADTSGAGDLQGKDGSRRVSGYWLQAVVARLNESIEAEDKSQRIYGIDAVVVGQLVLPLGPKQKLGLPDVGLPPKNQRIQSAESDVFTESKRYKAIAVAARNWKLMRVIQRSVDGLVPGIVDNLRKATHWKIEVRVNSMMESAACD